VFEGADFDIKMNASTAIVGPSGSGKSTIVQLINRYYDLDQGTLTIGDDDIKNISLEKLRASIGYVSQEPAMIVGTILDNMKNGKCDATD